MIISNLSHLLIDEVIECFIQAFSDYFVPVPSDHNYFKERWKASKVDLRLSFGVIDDNRLVAFILHGIDERNGQKTAYNAGTGVIPAYRGRRLVQEMYQVAIPELASKGITRSVLEVITQNEKAIKAYQSVGFRTVKTVKCFDGAVPEMDDLSVQVKELSHDQINWEQIPNQSTYCWDHQVNSLKEGRFRFFMVHEGNKQLAFFAINLALNSLAQWEVLESSSFAWSALLAGIGSVTRAIKVNNVDALRADKIDVLAKAGFTNVIDQYEMELAIT